MRGGVRKEEGWDMKVGSSWVLFFLFIVKRENFLGDVGRVIDCLMSFL